MRSTLRQARAALHAGGEDFGKQLSRRTCAAIRAAASRLGSRSARPPSSSAVFFAGAHGLGDARCHRGVVRRWGLGGRMAGGQGTPPSPQDTSAGRISVATWPGRPFAAATGLSAASWLSSPRWTAEVRTKPGRHVARHGLDVALQLSVVLRVGRWRGRPRC